MFAIFTNKPTYLWNLIFSFAKFSFSQQKWKFRSFSQTFLFKKITKFIQIPRKFYNFCSKSFFANIFKLSLKILYFRKICWQTTFVKFPVAVNLFYLRHHLIYHSQPIFTSQVVIKLSSFGGSAHDNLFSTSISRIVYFLKTWA